MVGEASGSLVGGVRAGMSRRVGLFGMLAAGCMSVATFVHVIVTVSRHVVTSDSVVLWYAAPEWAHLRLHEPGFYGQAYGSTFAAVPMAFLHALGMTYALSLPIVLGASILTVWFALGIAAYRRGHVTTAVFALAAPALFSAAVITRTALGSSDLLVSTPRQRAWPWCASTRLRTAIETMRRR